jgi:uncharacterized LabA/DUF88 family protein
MDLSVQSLPPLKSALFVDFDNIYIALSKTDPQAAERFASDPARWLSWLEQGYPIRAGERSYPSRQRSILVRRCYPNPDAGFRRFRSFFTSAAFSVVDCPSMTRTGKNSSDIYMVMDILDTLNHKTYFDEFIILSGDSDFMPVLLRLRAHDRRTTTLNIDFMPPAFRAACDLVISEEDFIEDALGISHEAGEYPTVLNRTNASTELLQEMALRVFGAVSSSGEVAGASLPEILKDFREFRDSTNWLGFGTSQRLAEGLAACDPRLQLVRLNPMMYKIMLNVEETAVKNLPQRVPLAAEMKPRGKSPAAVGRSARLVGRPGKALTLPAVQMGNQVSDEMAVEAVESAEKPSNGEIFAQHVEKVEKTGSNTLRDQILSAVKEVVDGSPVPLLLARVSQAVVNRVGHQVIDSQWAGSGTFKRLLQSADDLGLQITTQPEPGYIFDPVRHTPPSPARAPDPSRQRTVNAPRRKRGEVKDEETIFGLPEADTGDYLLESLPDSYGSESEEDQEAVYRESLPSLEEFIRRVSRVTGAPDLTPQQFALVFKGIVCELQQIAQGEKAYHTYQSAKAISDWCAEQGNFIARGDIMLILKGIIFQDGPRFAKRPGSYSAHELAVVVRTNIKALCRRSRMEFSEYEDRLLDEWIIGCLDQSSPSSNGSAEPETTRQEGPQE